MTYRLELLEQHIIDHIKPAEEAVDDRPQHRVVVGVGDRDGKRRAEADAVFCAFDAVIDERSVHEALLGCELWSTIGRKMRGQTISRGDVMRMRIGVIALALFAAAASGIVLAREPESAGKIESQQLFVKELAGDPSKENAQSYTFPIGAVLPWHVHPDADESRHLYLSTRRRAAAYA